MVLVAEGGRPCQSAHALLAQRHARGRQRWHSSKVREQDIDHGEADVEQLVERHLQRVSGEGTHLDDDVAGLVPAIGVPVHHENHDGAVDEGGDRQARNERAQALALRGEQLELAEVSDLVDEHLVDRDDAEGGDVGQEDRDGVRADDARQEEARAVLQHGEPREVDPAVHQEAQQQQRRRGQPETRALQLALSRRVLEVPVLNVVRARRLKHAHLLAPARWMVALLDVSEATPRSDLRILRAAETSFHHLPALGRSALRQLVPEALAPRIEVAGAHLAVEEGVDAGVAIMRGVEDHEGDRGVRVRVGGSAVQALELAVQAPEAAMRFFSALLEPLEASEEPRMLPYCCLHGRAHLGNIATEQLPREHWLRVAHHTREEHARQLELMELVLLPRPFLRLAQEGINVVGHAAVYHASKVAEVLVQGRGAQLPAVVISGVGIRVVVRLAFGGTCPRREGQVALTAPGRAVGIGPPAGRLAASPHCRSSELPWQVGHHQGVVGGRHACFVGKLVGDVSVDSQAVDAHDEDGQERELQPAIRSRHDAFAGSKGNCTQSVDQAEGVGVLGLLAKRQGEVHHESRWNAGYEADDHEGAIVALQERQGSPKVPSDLLVRSREEWEELAVRRVNGVPVLPCSQAIAFVHEFRPSPTPQMQILVQLHFVNLMILRRVSVLEEIPEVPDFLSIAPLRSPLFATFLRLHRHLLGIELDRRISLWPSRRPLLSNF
eukprot:scaffold1954_cov268-Pinguiococcus_pyrenoidosus.AAC.35